jgi:hypothetical protein
VSGPLSSKDVRSEVERGFGGLTGLGTPSAPALTLNRAPIPPIGQTGDGLFGPAWGIDREVLSGEMSDPVLVLACPTLRAAHLGAP